MGIYGRRLLAMWRHPDKFGDHMSCDGRDKVFLICHLTTRLTKGFCEWNPLTLSQDHVMLV